MNKMRLFKLTTCLIASIWLTAFVSGYVSGKWEGTLILSEIIVFAVIGYMIVTELFDNY